MVLLRNRIDGFMAVRLLEDDALQQIKPDGFSTFDSAIAVNADSLATWFEPVAWQLTRQRVSLEIIVDDQNHLLAALARDDVKAAGGELHVCDNSC